MIPVIVILLYLALIAFIGSIAFRRGKTNTEDFFLANRSVGEMVFFLSLFATNMTAFAILGSSGQSYRQGIGIYGLMASSSGFVIPLTIFFIGTRLWAIGKRFGHQTQVAFFRDRWECDTIGTIRSEEHTSELQSHSDLVCRLLLEKKKQKTNIMC